MEILTKKMNNMKKIFLFVITICLLTSCKDWGWMEPIEPHQTPSSDYVQTIMGATDCVENSGWSWIKGKATAAFDGTCIFSFVAKEEGELIFKVSSYYDDMLIVSVGSVALFNRENYYSQHFESYSVSCGNVHQGAKISFKGRSFQPNDPLRVTDVKIIKSN